MRIVDIHCHILYGVDDGAGDMNEAVGMITEAYREGITDIILTPHYKEGRRNAGPERIRERLAHLRQVIARQGIPVNLYEGNEFFYCSEVDELLERGAICTLNGSDYILVEFSPYEDYVYIRNGLDNVMGLGYTPILAHVERYECMAKRLDHVRELHEMGIMIQVNGSGIIGDAGGQMKRYLQQLLKEQLVDFVATDAHNCGQRKPEMKRCSEYLYKKYERSYVDTILYRNAEDILAGQ